MINLDYQAARFGLEMVTDVTDTDDCKNLENLVNQALGILCEQSPFAMMLWGEPKFKANSRKMGNALWCSAIRLLQEAKLLTSDFPLPNRPNRRPNLKRLNDDLCSDFTKLAVARELLERMLVYARYYAKSTTPETCI